MDIFGSKKSYLGVDLGTSAIKMVELENKSNRAVLSTYGYTEQPTDVIRASSEEMEGKIINIIRSVYRESRMTSKKVIAALPSFSVFSSIISLPAMGKKDLGEAIQWEAKKFIPLPLEEMRLDWKIIPEQKPVKKLIEKNFSPENLTGKKANNEAEGIPQKENNSNNQSSEEKKKLGANLPFLAKILNKNKDSHQFGKKDSLAKNNLKILLTAAPRSLVEKYIRIFKAADLELMSLETEAFALERSLSGNDPAPVMIIDIGALTSDVCLIDNGIPILTRSIDVGGLAITKAVMNSLNVDLARAEQFKRDIGFSAAGPSDLPDIIKNTINPIINEVKYCLDIYFSQSNHSKTMEKIILTGGSSYLPDLPKYLTKLLDLKVIIGDPWDRVVYPMELKPVLDEIGPRFSVAVGLAMREI